MHKILSKTSMSFEGSAAALLIWRANPRSTSCCRSCILTFVEGDAIGKRCSKPTSTLHSVDRAVCACLVRMHVPPHPAHPVLSLPPSRHPPRPRCHPESREVLSLVEYCVDTACRHLLQYEDLPPGLPTELVDRILHSLTMVTPTTHMGSFSLQTVQSNTACLHS
jgi:hypothetical protein